MDDQERNFVSNANLENGYDGHNRVRPDYLQDFTYRVIPLCAVILVFFSDGAILICTLAFDRPLPRKGVIVVSGMLAVFFAIFGIGGMFIYRRRYHPPLSKDPNCPGRTLRSRSGSRQGRMRKAATWVTSVAKATERYVKTRWSKMPVAEETSSQRNSPSRDDRPLARPPNEDDRLTVEHIEPVDFNRITAGYDDRVLQEIFSQQTARTNQMRNTPPNAPPRHREQARRADNFYRTRGGMQENRRKPPARQGVPRGTRPASRWGACQRPPRVHQQTYQALVKGSAAGRAPPLLAGFYDPRYSDASSLYPIGEDYLDGGGDLRVNLVLLPEQNLGPEDLGWPQCENDDFFARRVPPQSRPRSIAISTTDVPNTNRFNEEEIPPPIPNPPLGLATPYQTDYNPELPAHERDTETLSLPLKQGHPQNPKTKISRTVSPFPTKIATATPEDSQARARARARAKNARSNDKRGGDHGHSQKTKKKKKKKKKRGRRKKNAAAAAAAAAVAAATAAAPTTIA